MKWIKSINMASDRRNSPFTADQLIFITCKFGDNFTLSETRRAFGTMFYPKNYKRIPNLKAFERVRKRLETTANAHTQHPPGLASVSAEDIESVRRYFDEHKKAHIRQATLELNLSYGKIWRILRQELKWKSYRPHQVQALSLPNKLSRMAACSYWLTFNEDWFERVIWTDEKWFLLKQSPNKQVDRFWAPFNPHELVECKQAHASKVMAWVGIVDGRCLPVVWFDGSVNGDVYLNQVLKETVWPNVKNTATRRQYWFQQDGASCHVTAPCLEFLSSKFGDRVISRNTQHHWPPYSPDLSPLDFSFWSQAMMHVNQHNPTTIGELKLSVENFANNIEPEIIRKMARNTRKRAALCIQADGGHFEHLL